MTGPRIKTAGCVALLALAVGACSKGAPAVYIPNATHVNGIPVEDYKPSRSDRRKDMVVTVASPATTTAPTASVATAASTDVDTTTTGSTSGTTTATTTAATTAASTASTASTVASVAADTATTAASTTTAAASAAGTGSSALSDMFVPLAAIAAPVVIAAADLSPDGDALSALMQDDDKTLRVTLVDRATSRAVSAQISAKPAAGATVVHVSGLGADGALTQAIRAYVAVCDVNYDSVVRFTEQPGATARTSAGFALMTDTCPGLWSYARFNR